MTMDSTKAAARSTQEEHFLCDDKPRPISPEDLTLMRWIGELHLERPFAGPECCATFSPARASRLAAGMSRR